jgi:hypothetical protein
MPIVPDPATTEWVPIWNPQSTGPVGPTGPSIVGPTGAQGVPGPTGPLAIGPSGPTGPQGSQGVAGPTGAQGAPGSVGTHAPTHSVGAGDPVNVRNLAGYSGINTDVLRGDATFAGGVAFLATTNRFTGVNTFVGPSTTLENPSGVYFNFYETGAGVNLKRIAIITSAGNFYVQTQNDAGVGIANILLVTNAGVITGNGSGLTSLNASNLASGIAAPARLGNGVANSSVFLRGDSQWAGIDLSFAIPSGLIAMFATSCPSGWTRVAGLDNRVPLGSTSTGATGGASTHAHNFDQQADQNGSHSHGVTGSGSGATAASNTNSPINEGGQGATFNGTNSSFAPYYHSHHIDPISVSTSVTGSTDTSGNHDHRVRGVTDQQSSYPPYFTVVFCQKN